MTDYLSLINDISTQSLDIIINNDTSNFLQDEEPPILVDVLNRTFTLQSNSTLLQVSAQTITLMQLLLIVLDLLMDMIF